MIQDIETGVRLNFMVAVSMHYIPMKARPLRIDNGMQIRIDCTQARHHNCMLLSAVQLKIMYHNFCIGRV